MANRGRPIRKKICIAEQEEQIIKSKMSELGTHNFKIASDGEITMPNYLAAALPSVTVRIESGRTTYRFSGSYDGSKKPAQKTAQPHGKRI